VRGTVRAKRKKKVTFTATRARLTTVTTTTVAAVTTTTTTTLAPPPPAACRNGVLDPGEQCDHDPQCGRRAICTPDCTCLPLPGEPAPTTEQKIDDALQAGRIDYGTSLLYRAYAFYGDAAAAGVRRRRRRGGHRPDLGQLQLFFLPGQPPQYSGTGSTP